LRHWCRHTNEGGAQDVEVGKDVIDMHGSGGGAHDVEVDGGIVDIQQKIPTS
jgi:hypothetical protein